MRNQHLLGATIAGAAGAHLASSGFDPGNAVDWLQLVGALIGAVVAILGRDR